jgi:hypothetical protein
MERVPEVLQLTIVVEGGGAPALEPKLSQKLKLLFRGALAQRGVTKKLFESRFLFETAISFSFDELISPRVLESQSLVEHDIPTEGPKVDRP